MANNTIGWGQGATNNDIGWGRGSSNDIGWGSVYDSSYVGDTDIVGGDTRFIIRIDTTQAGSAADTFVLPWIGTYDVDWGDGNVDLAVTGTQTHVYASSGIYDVKVTAATGQISFANLGDKSKLIDIRNWGNVGWTTMDSAFWGCNNLTNVTASDAPDLSSVTNMNSAFRNCSSLTTLDVSAWDTSNITTMLAAFYFCTSLTTLDVSGWDTSSITIMQTVFAHCSSLTTLGVSGWDTGSVANMSNTFRNCSSLTNLDVSLWDIDQVTSFTSFAQSVTIPTATYDDILNNWESQLQTSFPDGVGYLPNISINFGGSQNSYLSSAAKRKLTTDKALGGFGWSITDSGQTDTAEFIITVKTDNTGTSSSDQFTLPWVGTYDVDWGDGISDAGVSGTQTHTYSSIGTYDVKVTAATGQIYFNNTGDKSKLIDIRNWGNVGWTTMLYAFYGCDNLTNVTASDVPDLSSVTDMFQAFRGCSSLTTLDVGAWDTSSFTNLFQTFLGCSSLTYLDVSTWDTSSVTNVIYTFFNCSSLTVLDVSSWDTSSVTNMQSTFQNCSSLTDLDVSAWDIDQVTVFTNFATGVTIPTATYDATLIAWEAQAPTSGLSIHFGGSEYTAGGAAEAARTSLQVTYGWTIVDGGPA